MSTDCNSSVEENERVLSSLVRMEAESSAIYTCPDYLMAKRENSLHGEQVHLNEVWRSKVCEWFYRVVDRHPENLSRDIVYISMNILDRFLAKTSLDINLERERAKAFYQLTAMTAIYVGAKVLYRRNHLTRASNKLEFLETEVQILSVEALVGMSTAGFRVKDILEMEKCFLSTLHWQICPITPSSFVRMMLSVFCKREDTYCIDEIYQNARFLCELAACDYYFVGSKASEIALSSILLSLDSVEGGLLNTNRASFLAKAQQKFEYLGLTSLVDYDHVFSLGNRLAQLHAEQFRDKSNDLMPVEAVVNDPPQNYGDRRPSKRLKMVRVVSSEDLSQS